MMPSLNRPGGWLLVLLMTGAATSTVTGQTGLVDAVRRDDRAAVQKFLQQQVDVNRPEPDGTTALYWAVEGDDLETVDMLIRAGANANATSRYGIAPLYSACLHGNVAIIEVLLDAGADANTSTLEGETTLMTAARTGVTGAVEVLLSRGADVDAREGWRGQTALMWAAGEGHVETIAALLEHSADIDARSIGGWSPLLFAVREGRKEVVRALLDAGADVNDRLPPQGRSVRVEAVVPTPPTGGPSALAVAVESNHYELAAFLLERGADPNEDAQGWTPLHRLTWMRKPGRGTNRPGPTGSGNLDSLELIKMLVAHGADVNAQVRRQPPRGNTNETDLNMVGGTPLFLAARTGDAPMMRLLAELGADPSLRNEDDSTLLMAAAGIGTHSPGEDPGTESEALAAVKVALELGNDVNAVDKNWDTAMHGAAIKQFPSVVKLLAERGADIETWNNKNVSGWTPLRIAVGVHRGMNFRFSIPTANALREVMIAAGVSTEVVAIDVLIYDLIQGVIALNLNAGIADALDAKLDAVMNARDDVNANNDVGAINALYAFINAVEAQRGKQLTDAQADSADSLVAAAQVIMSELGG